MSTTRKQIGPAEGYAKVEKEAFSNPGQQAGNCGMGGVHDRAPTDPQFTTTRTNCDGMVKDSAKPHVGSEVSPSGAWHGVRVGTNSAVENYGK